ncbi:hypothetical protein GCM10020220_000360 [Nonomuraea rubra]|uniref:hypothetical protein n=1 Tax=Nonomuraea rubra TaxID=46180 RepID=UPI0031EEDA61
MAVPSRAASDAVLDVLVTRKIGYPPTPELRRRGRGAEGARAVFDPLLLATPRHDPEDVAYVWRRNGWSYASARIRA